MNSNQPPAWYHTENPNSVSPDSVHSVPRDVNRISREVVNAIAKAKNLPLGVSIDAYEKMKIPENDDPIIPGMEKTPPRQQRPELDYATEHAKRHGFSPPGEHLDQIDGVPLGHSHSWRNASAAAQARIDAQSKPLFEEPSDKNGAPGPNIPTHNSRGNVVIDKNGLSIKW